MIVDLEKRWLPKAACTGADLGLFFVDHGTKGLTDPTPKTQQAWNRAKKVCAICPVKRECARDSLGEQEGVWGGLDPAERHSMRITHTNQVRKMTGAERAEYTRMAHTLRMDSKYPVQDVARIMGVTTTLVNQLVDEHAKHRQEQQAEINLKASGQLDEVVGLKPVDFPEKDPINGDAWVRYNRLVVRAYYLGETEGGEWFYLKASLSREYSVCWFKAENVDMRRTVEPRILHRVGPRGNMYVNSGSAQRQAG